MSSCHLCELYKKQIESLNAEIADLLYKKKIRDEHNIELQRQIAQFNGSKIVLELPRLS